MPIIQSAKKALKQSKKREAVNKKTKSNLKASVKAFKKSPSQTTLKKVYSSLDTAVKKKAIHKNKAARLKSRLSKLLKKHPKQKISKKSPKK